ncbi:hypothetical protein Tco_1231488 [Tanacetum coccineum]
MSAMANTTPIVTTVMKLATKEKTPKDVDATPKVIEGGAHSTNLVILTHQAQLNPDRTCQTPGIVLIVEAALTGGTLLTEIVLGAETAPAASKNHMMMPAPPTGRGPNMDITPTTDTALVM